MPRRPAISALELDVLRFITDHDSASVGEAAKHFAVTRGHARSTVVTVMDRLRKKGHLTRKKVDGVYRYSARVGKGELLHALVHDFVQGALGGSVSPFVAYLSQRSEMADADVEELERFLAELRRQREGEEQ
ncbi:MAG TPA: BlaI/MecI/CopY family transcriptional regulator [Armatimonadota bacterium]|jgi:predicted transcriptional regulator|nr:BlaI/MecI/CopY family transcriptional regulator [Armatimonadota bacterium]